MADHTTTSWTGVEACNADDITATVSGFRDGVVLRIGTDVTVHLSTEAAVAVRHRLGSALIAGQPAARANAAKAITAGAA